MKKNILSTRRIELKRVHASTKSIAATTAVKSCNIKDARGPVINA
jgi:hypothetical protein